MDIQEALNNAMAQSLGYYDANSLIASIPKELRLDSTDKQEQFNHAMALQLGFNSVDDFIAAKGMTGTAGLKSIKA